MTRTVEVTVYRFEELDGHTQQRILDNFREGRDFPWSDEWRESLDEFAKLAPITVRDWSVGYRDTGVSFSIDEDIGNLSGIRAWKWLVNNGWQKLALNQDCPFTGFCGDETLLDAIRQALRKPQSILSLEDVFGEALHDWAKGFEADMEYHYSDEAIRESIIINEYEFYENGTLA